MRQRELEKLSAKIKNELRAEGQIIDVGRDYNLTVINLILTGILGNYAVNDLYFARGDQDPIYPGEHADASLDESADKTQEVLKRIYDWEKVTRVNEISSIDVAVSRDGPTLKRNLYVGGRRVVTPDDPSLPPMI